MQKFDAFLDLLTMLASDFRMGGLFILLVMAAVSDWRFYRIPNWLTFGGMAFAVIYGTFAARMPMSGALNALGGLGTGLVIMLPFYVLGIMGAGDVKLMAMVGAFLGPYQTLQAILFTCIAGGFAAIVVAIHRRRLVHMLCNVKDAAQGIVVSGIAGIRPTGTIDTRQSIGKLPYGICICVGTIAQVLAHQLGFV
ncbi:prepilin peptidase [Variovorax paradoxus]|uniref:Type IV leader peptidase family protein n=1 Tax=Variovorax paradoxus TaxID=34073 RepID=A0A0H2M2Q6_VARPD|nr:prepilin peptidase [Variovorax paradoxus]KLN55002.1 type IV leader peptidase family protein [Variovorax paradoxus]